MKVLNTEFEYRQWMEKEYFQFDDKFPSIFEPDELERELLNQMPHQFPCIVFVVKGPRPSEPETLQFIYRDQVEKWAKILGIIN